MTSISDGTYRISDGSDDKVFQSCEATKEGNGVTSISDGTYHKSDGSDDKVFQSCEASDEGNGVTSSKDEALSNDEDEGSQVWPTDLITIISQITSMPITKMAEHDFVFDLSMAAAEKNADLLLNKYGGKLADAIDANKHSILGYGSEFRPVEVLTKIYKNHPVWDRMKSILSNGSDWPLETIDESQRIADVEAAISFGNHKGAEERREELAELVSNDVRF